MFGALPTYGQVKEFWNGYFKAVQKFYTDWAEDVKTTFSKKED